MTLSRHNILSNPPSPSPSSSLFISPPSSKVYLTYPHPHLNSPNMPRAFSQYTTSHTAPPKFARKQHHHQHQNQPQRASGFIHARVASVDMDRLMDRFLSFQHPQSTPTPAVDLPAPQQAPAPYIGGTYPYTSMAMEDDEHQYHHHQHFEYGHQHHHHINAHEHAHEHQHHYQSQSQYQLQQQHHHNGYEYHYHQYQDDLSDTAATHQYNHHDHHHHHAHSQPNPLYYNQTHPGSPSPAPTPLVSTRRHDSQVSVPTYGREYGTDSHRPHSNTHNGNNGGQYTQSPYVYVHQPEPQQAQQQQQQHHERHYAVSPSPSSSSYSSSSSLHHCPSSSSSSWASSSSSSSHHYPSASFSSSSWASSSSSSSPAPATPSSSSYWSLSPFSSPAPQPQPQPHPHPQPNPQPEPQPAPRTRTRTRKAASKSTQSYHAKAATKCKVAAKANILRKVVNSPVDAPTPETCTAAAKAASSPTPSSSSSLPLPRRRRRPSPASGPSIPIPERKPPKNAAALAKLFPCPDGTYLHVRHYTDFPIPIPDNKNDRDSANSQPKTYVPDSHLHLFWRSALAKFDPPDDTRWMPMARDTGVRRSGKQVWTCTAMIVDPKAGHPRPRPCGHTRAKSTLIRHINDVHINIRNYRCPWNGCEESFHHRFQLETHVFSMHTFESPYECPTKCGAAFKDRAVLSKHHTNIHGCSCTLCPARFGDAVKLAAHWQDAHPGQPVPESVPLGSPTTSAEFCEDEDEEDVDCMDESE